MAYTIQEIESGPLSNLYPSLYSESQIKNQSRINVVVTEQSGAQYVIPATPGVGESESRVQIEYRSCNGLRLVRDKNSVIAREAPIKGYRIDVPLQEFYMHPLKIVERNIIISTVDHSGMAKDMVRQDRINPLNQETRVDHELSDPRFVFQVNDPGHIYDVLFVNVFGQTIILRAGCWGEILPSEASNKTGELDYGSLLCYLRYPNDYSDATPTLTTVFEIGLENLIHEEPIKLPSGDIVCVATSMESLQKVIAKKSSGASTMPSYLASKMIPKEVHDAALSAVNAERDQIKQTLTQKIQNVTVSKDAKIAELQAELAATKREKESAEFRERQWEEISKARAKAQSDDADVSAAQERVRKEALENSRKEIDNMWTCVKIGASVASGIVSFVVTVLLKSKK